MFKTGPLFPLNYHATEQVVVNQGGTSSGKTYTILQVLFALLASGPGNQVATVAGQDIPNLKAGALRDARAIVADSEVLGQLVAKYNESDRIFTLTNGSLLEFKSYDSAQDAKSGKRDYLFVNEAQGVPYPVYKELALRTRLRTFVDYNPNAEFWVHEQLVGRPGVLFLRSWHEHNPFLSDQTRAAIEALATEDPELWRVYARGLTGKIEGLVFRNTYPAPGGVLPEGAKYVGTGLDFGFTNDPTAVYDVYLSGGELYLDELLYQPGLTNPDIARLLLATSRLTTAPLDIVADSAEPKSIEELRRAGLTVTPAQKGPDSLLAGIGTLKAYRLNLLPSCVNLKKEASSYKWKVDRLTGKALNEPVDAFNHGWDAVRYLAQARLGLPAVPGRRARVNSRIYSGR